MIRNKDNVQLHWSIFSINHVETNNFITLKQRIVKIVLFLVEPAELHQLRAYHMLEVKYCYLKNIVHYEIEIIYIYFSIFALYFECYYII